MTIISDVLSLDEHLSQTNTSCILQFCYQIVYRCLIRYFLVRIGTAKCFTKISKRFRCEVMSMSEDNFPACFILTCEPRHVDVWGSRPNASCILYIGTRWRWMASFMLRPLYSRCPLIKRLGVPDSWFGWSHEKKSQSILGIEPMLSSL
jgi:hypothetical protein